MKNNSLFFEKTYVLIFLKGNFSGIGEQKACWC